MPRFVKCNRRILLLAIVASVLSLGGFAIVRERTRWFPDLIAEASAAYARRDWDQTASLAHRRLKETPDDAEVLRWAARAAARQDQHAKAIAIYNRFVVGAMEPEDFFLLGRALSRTGQLDAAFKAYETAREAAPEHAETLEALALLYLQNDRYFAAEDAAERLTRHPAWEAPAQLMLGTARAEVQDPAGAAAALRRWLQLDPQGRAALPHPAASFQKLLARSLLKSGQPEEARRVLRSLLQTGPDSEASWLLSRCFIQTRDWKQAAAVLEGSPSYRAENPLESEPAPYVGEQRCAACHRPQYDAVLASRHATTIAHGRDLGQFSLPKAPVPDPGNPQVTHHFERDGDSLRVETRKGTDVWRAVVDYAFGSRDHYSTFVGRDDQGRSFMIRMSPYHSPRGSGWDLSTGLPAQPDDDEEYLGKKMVARDGVRRCLYCHTTSFRAVMHQSGPAAADHSIGCERCHGPGGHHIAAVEAGFADSAIANPGQAPAAAINDVCGKCHSMQRPENVTGSRADPVWLRFQSLTLTWSRCYTESPGTLSCVTCHDPHRNADRSASRNEAKCLTCHGRPTSAPFPPQTPQPAAGRTGSSPARPDPDPPTPAAKSACPVNPSSGCIECHMPRQWREETHSFKTDHFIRVHDAAASGS